MSERITDVVARRAESPDRKQAFVWDTEVKGFGLRVTMGGSKAFVLDYRTHGRQRRMTIGSYPDWSVAAARVQARDLKREVDLGGDPMGSRHDVRGSPTVKDLWERYRKEHLALKSLRSRQDQEAMWRQIILPRIGVARLSQVSSSDMAALHRWVTVERGTPVRANRTIEVLRKAFNLAIQWGWASENPAIGVARNREDQRQRYLSAVELGRLFRALDAHDQRTSAEAIKLLALTGARKSEVLGARWEMFDLDAGVWAKPAGFTKQRKAHRTPLSANAVALLRRRKLESEGPYVFPGKSADHPLTDIKRTWAAACEAAGLFDVTFKRTRDGKPILDKDGNPVTIKQPSARLHDLRHSFASLLVSSGKSLPLVGALLGHTQTQTTQRYAHLHDDPMREATEQVDALIAAAANRD